MDDGTSTSLGGRVIVVLVCAFVVGSVATPAVALGTDARDGTGGADAAPDDTPSPAEVEDGRIDGDRSDDDGGDPGDDRSDRGRGDGDDGDDRSDRGRGDDDGSDRGDGRSAGSGDDGDGDDRDDTSRSDLNESDADGGDGDDAEDGDASEPSGPADGRRMSPVGSVPAPGRLTTLEQPNGVTFEARKWGDAFHHGWETARGYTIVKNDRGYWAYARVDGGSLVATDRLVGIESPPSVKKHVRTDDPDTYQVIKSDGETVRMTESELREVAPKAVPSTGTVKFPVILINFTDKSTSYSESDFQSLLFGNDPSQATGPGSVTDYYDAASYGQVTVTGDVAGWVTADNTHDYYGANDDSGDDKHAGELVKEAVQKADDQIDYSQYDNNNDGEVDQVVVIHQGMGEEVGGASSTNIWSHHWSLSAATGSSVTLDGMTVDEYTIQPEEYTESDDTMTAIGVISHELGHAFGLPDLYDTDYSSSGIGDWGLMAGGSWNKVNQPGDSPAHFTAWSKQYLGWIDPVNVTAGESVSGVSLGSAAQNSDYYQVLDPANNSPEQYFLVSNRQQVGFDQGLPGEGVMITDINESLTDGPSYCTYYNNCNDDETNKLVDVEAADGNGDLDAGNGADSGDPWTSTDFTPDSTPNSNYDNGTTSNVKVTSISFSGDTASLSISADTADPLTEKWNASGDGRSQFATPALGTDRVVMGGLDGTVRAVYRANGTVDWTFERAGSLSDSSPAIANGRVFVGSGGGTLYALDLQTGGELWNHSTDSAVVSSPAVAGGTVYVGANDGDVMALDASSGSVQWTATVGAAVYSSVAVDGASDTVYVTTDDGSLVALNATNGNQRWSTDVGTNLGHSSPVVDGGDVYVAGDKLYRLNADGSLVWAKSYGPASASSPRIHDGSVYVGSADGSLYAFFTNGTFRWSHDTGAAIETTPAASGSRVVVGNDAGEVHLLDTAGTDVANASLGARIWSSPVVGNDVVYVGSKSGTLWALENL